MEITFEEDYLRELYYEGKTHNKKYRFQPQIIKKYIRVIDLMESLNCTEDFYRYKALHYEALVGDKKDRESVKVNDQYRIEFRSEIINHEKRLLSVTFWNCQIIINKTYCYVKFRFWFLSYSPR